MALNPLRFPRSASKAISDPFGDQAASPLTPFESVSFLTQDPSGFIAKTSLTCLESLGVRSVRSLSKASRLPSGDHTAHPLSYLPAVSSFAPERSEFATQICQWPAPSFRMYAIRP